MNRISKIILVLLIVILAISSYFFIKELMENKKENDIYVDLQEIVDNSTNENDNTAILENKTSNVSTENNYNLENIVKINSDVVAWVKIDGTNIDYPIMQNGDFYLHKNIYKNYSSHGTPYLAYYCDLKKSDNLIIYGHHMNDNTMFSQLEKYKNYDFFLNHQYIKLYTLENGETIENNYEIMIAFKTVAYSDKGFKYYSYIDFQNYMEYEEFVKGCRNTEFYYTGVVGTHKDKYITLSTCEYSQKNGRMVVVAKKI